MIPGFGISLLLHCRSLNGALANITVLGLSDDEKQQEGRGRMDLTVSTHNKSGSVLVVKPTVPEAVNSVRNKLGFSKRISCSTQTISYWSPDTGGKVIDN